MAVDLNNNLGVEITLLLTCSTVSLLFFCCRYVCKLASENLSRDSEYHELPGSSETLEHGTASMARDSTSYTLHQPQASQTGRQSARQTQLQKYHLASAAHYLAVCFPQPGQRPLTDKESDAVYHQVQDMLLRNGLTEEALTDWIKEEQSVVRSRMINLNEEEALSGKDMRHGGSIV